MEKLYKILNIDGSCYHGGTGKWPLPVKNTDGTWTPGEWLEVIGDLVVCGNGLHLCREQDLLAWLGPAIFAAESDGERFDSKDKIVVRKARLLRRCTGWTERTARLFACDCAERVLPIYEKVVPGDNRARDCIAVARRYADGATTLSELAAAGAATWGAAGAAALAAAGAAAGAAAWDAAEGAAGAAAWDAAWDAAWGAAWDAAWDAAWAAAGAAEKAWQTQHLVALLEA